MHIMATKYHDSPFCIKGISVRLNHQFVWWRYNMETLFPFSCPLCEKAPFTGMVWGDLMISFWLTRGSLWVNIGVPGTLWFLDAHVMLLQWETVQPRMPIMGIFDKKIIFIYLNSIHVFSAAEIRYGATHMSFRQHDNTWLIHCGLVTQYGA